MMVTPIVLMLTTTSMQIFYDKWQGFGSFLVW